jgi:hypothetical protein
MAGLDPAIHVYLSESPVKDADGRPSPAMTGDEWQHFSRHKHLELGDSRLLGSDELQ